MNKKVLQKMHDKGVISSQELQDGVVSEEVYDMYIGGVEMLDGIVRDPRGHLKAYQELLADPNQDKTHVKGQIRKLEKLLKKPKYKEQKSGMYGAGVVKMRKRKEKSQKAEVQTPFKRGGKYNELGGFYGVWHYSSIGYNLRFKTRPRFRYYDHYYNEKEPLRQCSKFC